VTRELDARADALRVSSVSDGDRIVGFLRDLKLA
jgi:hypothetical protein